VFVNRAKDVGVISRTEALEWGVTGPNLRATGLAFDVRRDDPYLVYDQLAFDVPIEHAGDAWARTLVRRAELQQSTHILRQIVERLPGVAGPIRAPIPNPLAWRVPAGETYVKAECTRGEYAYYLVTDGSQYIRRIHVRGPSYTHAVALMERLAVGTNIADIAGLMVSLHTYPPEIER